jgi:Hpt domain
VETGTPEEQFEKLRQRFYVRLRKERSQLAVLTAALESADGTSAAILLNIQAFAHRLRGAALVFGFQGLGDGAKAVERAATTALRDASGRQCRPSVAATMQELAISLTDEIRTGARAIPIQG